MNDGEDDDDVGQRNTGAVTSIDTVTYPLGGFTVFHIYVSIGICVVFVKLLNGLKRKDKREALSSTAAPLPGQSPGRREMP